MKLRIHHAYVGVLLIGWSILTVKGIFVVGEFNFYVWLVGLILGIFLLVHDVFVHGWKRFSAK